MKKYFLKIAGFTTIAIPLVVVIACGKKKQTSSVKPLTWEQMKAKFVNIHSSKTKDDIKLPPIGKKLHC